MVIRPVSLFVAGFLLVLGSACATDYLFLASKSVEEKHYQNAVEFLKEGASKGDERCDYYLAVLMLSGKLEGERDPRSASEWLHNAATAGHSNAQLSLGQLYEVGDGVDRDLVKAVEWYIKAAEAGLPAGQSQLGILYASGTGVEQDTASAIKLYKKAAKRGDPLGQAALGAAYYNGAGVRKSIIDGYIWTKLASRQGNPMARSNLPVIVSEMTPAELKTARFKVSKFTVETTKRKQDRLDPQFRELSKLARRNSFAGRSRRGTPGR